MSGCRAQRSATTLGAGGPSFSCASVDLSRLCGASLEHGATQVCTAPTCSRPYFADVCSLSPVDQLDVWHFIAVRILHLPRNVNPSFRRFGSFIHQSCWVCLLSDGRRIKTELFEYSSAGLVPVCKYHAAGFCGRCLAGPTGRASPQLSLQPASNEATLWGSNDALSCFDCRRDVLDLALERRGPDGPIRSDDDPAYDLYWSYIHDGEQEVEQAVLAIFERRWLAHHTNFPEIVQQVIESRALIERRPSRMTPADKRLMLHHMQAEINGLEGGDDLLGDELDAMEADTVDDDEELLESDESDEALSSYELRQVLDMSIQAWMGERVLNGAWLSPAELLSHYNLWLASRARGELPAAPVARGRAAANEQYCPSLLVQRPLLPFTERTSEHDPHPLPRKIHAVPPPPTDSVIITSMSEAYGREMRRILLPAMAQIVRHLETRRYPIAEATSLSAEAVIDLLRLPQAWIEGGMNTPAAGRRSQGEQRQQFVCLAGFTLKLMTARLPSFPDLSHNQRPPQPQPRRSSVEDATSHSPSPSATDTSQSISTPPQSTSPGRSLSLLPPPDSPRKPPAVLLEGLPHRDVAHPSPLPPAPLALASQLRRFGAASSAARPPPPPLRRSSEPPLVPFRPVEPVPCIPHASAPLGPETLAIIGSIWYEAWEPLRMCKCGICLRGMAMKAAAIAGSNSNGKRKEGSGGGGGKDRVESMQGVLGVVDASGLEAGEEEEEEEGNAKRARTEPPV